MSRPPFQRVVRRGAHALPPEVRGPLRRAGGAVLRQLPKPVAQEIRGVFGVRWGAVSGRPQDALGLSSAPGSARSPRGTTGRGAAAVQTDPTASARLERALGEVDTSRRGGGHRTVVGIMAPDVRDRLAADGYRTVGLQPGTSVAVAGRAEAVVVDLDGFGGLWEGALTTEGVPLMLELLAAVKAASQNGATCWLVVRGPRRSQIGSLLLMRSSRLHPVRPGEPRARAHHTEDPGDAPRGLADLLTAIEEPAHA